MKKTIDLSVVIPTFNRDELLEECLSSIMDQSVIPREVVIGNDSTVNVIDPIRLTEKFGFPIKVINRSASLGQARNVNDLMLGVVSEWLMLLHDDDKLIPNSLEDFFCHTSLVQRNVLIFGKQKLILKGEVQGDSEANSFNLRFFRSADTPHMTFFSIVMKQAIPSNGFILNSAFCKEIGYTRSITIGDYGLVKDACDYGFTWNLLFSNASFLFVDRFVSAYRINEQSVSVMTH